MILFILCVLIVLLCATYLLTDDIKYMIRYKEITFKNLVSKIGNWLFLNFVGDIFAFLIVAGLSACVTCLIPKQKSQYSFEIRSLKDNIVTTGKINSGIFSAKGCLDGELSYFYLRPTSKGEIVGHISAGKTYIRYDNEKPRIEVHQKSLKVPEIMSVVFFTECFVTNEIEYYVLYVPRGTISMIDEYQIDLE